MQFRFFDAGPAWAGPTRTRAIAHVLGTLAACCLCLLSSGVHAQADRSDRSDRTEVSNENEAGAIRLRQPQTAPQPRASTVDGAAATGRQPKSSADVEGAPAGEFEKFVQRLGGPQTEVRRLGAELMTGGQASAELSAQVPDDYVVAAGDEVLVTLWGAVEADLRLQVDRAGRITLPRVGAIAVAGVKYADLQATVTRRVAQVFKGFQINVALGQLRSVRVFVTGQVAKPGAYQVHALATALTALMQAGGPTAAGSFRNIEVRRSGRLVSPLDLYDLIVDGNRASDRQLLAGDVVHVGPVGNQVALIGSVNKPVVAELKPTETVADLLRFGAGFSPVADRGRLSLERIQDRNGVRVIQLTLPEEARLTLNSGDVLRAFSAVEARLSTERQSRRVLIEGEVLRPGEYVLPENSSLLDALKVAGGVTKTAYVEGTEFIRESVREVQAANYERALRELETTLTTHSASRRATTAEEVSAMQVSTNASGRLIDRLRQLKPSGRIVLNMVPGQTALPDLALEDGDRIRIPARPNTVGVFGSVFNAATYLYDGGKSLGDYLRLAGGATKGADEKSIFVVRANGEVVSNWQHQRMFVSTNSVGLLKALPGDTIFVPEEMDKQTFLQAAKDWTQVLFQFGIGISGIKNAIN